MNATPASAIVLSLNFGPWNRRLLFIVQRLRSRARFLCKANKGLGPGNFNHVDFAVLLGAEVERQGTPVRRPARRARQTAHGSNLCWIGAIPVADPDFRV